jgi:hypothetical protein
MKVPCRRKGETHRQVQIASRSTSYDSLNVDIDDFGNWGYATVHLDVHSITGTTPDFYCHQGSRYDDDPATGYETESTTTQSGAGRTKFSRNINDSGIGTRYRLTFAAHASVSAIVWSAALHLRAP